MNVDDFLEHGDSTFFVSGNYVKVEEKKGHSIFLFYLVAFPPLIILVGLVLLAPHIGKENPVGYVILTVWFLVGMFAYLHKKNIVIDLLRKEFKYKTSVIGFPLTDICRPLSEVTEVKCFALSKNESNPERGTVDYILVFKLNNKEFEINRTENKGACEQQKFFFSGTAKEIKGTKRVKKRKRGRCEPACSCLV